MNERFKQLRKATGLSQTEFAERVNLKRNTIASYEAGVREPVSAILELICREFGVNKDWLLTGEGEMFKTSTLDEELTTLVGSLLSDEEDSYKKRLINSLLKLSPTEWEKLEELTNRIIENYNNIKQENE